ncbi:Triosephosphate isomerase, chloroplastic [Auxenochlorella protothecoides]|uniref:Triosephosphate isomerase, chloroplastic n=1 Tax=Auxenochlorella protothecoides TaxID=3075 RepID=A0A087SQC7_AUXPR|nr:Triosephosphate isomerase, chloroplastic [Auxenochlorella protothecoides]KFM27931.1 Triosephosphate isomerase, chloroplastic [Auxenochlorella protothecoides]
MLSPAPSTPRSPHADQSDVLSAEEVVARRSGDVLLRHTILKGDHFPGCQNMKLRPLVDGAPNFRQVPGLPVYGVAIPTVQGLRRVLDLLGAAKGRRRVLWHSMREEPVLYVNGAPFVVREADKPFANLEYTGIDRERVEAMEARLKLDVLQESARYGAQILVAEEDDQFQVVQAWQPVSEADVQTPAEVYRELIEDGYDIDYLRVPVTDEKAPKGRDFDALIKRCWKPPKGAALVFNCQMGRGRTTTGMVIGTLLALRAGLAARAGEERTSGAGAKVEPGARPSIPRSFWDGPPQQALGAPFPDWFAAAPGGADEDASPAASPDVGEAELQAGNWGAVRSLLRVLEGGAASKAVLDMALDACAGMQNLRTAILAYRDRMAYERNDARRGALLTVCLEYLERYYSLIAFASYVGAPGYDPGDDPGYARCGGPDPVAGLSPAATPTQEEREIAAHRAARAGAVLGPRTLLKQDHFPGCQSERLAIIVPGAPNLRELPGVGVWGGAIPTREGMRGILEHVGAGPRSRGRSAGGQCRAVWTLMREEPVVYVNGAPYVLREASRPFKNLMEYRGIGRERLEGMEERLAADVESEAAARAGRLLVTREEEGGGPGARRTLRDELVLVAEVATPRSIARGLAGAGYRVTLVRVPLTDGTAPLIADFDTFYSSVAAAAPGDQLIYTCQMGGGRTTMGMVIGALLRRAINGAQIGMGGAQSTDNLDEDVGQAEPPPGRQGTPWDQESANLWSGEYVAVRRLVRILEHGAEAKAAVDCAVDAAGALINLRTTIMRYRRPKSLERFYRPEVQARHAAFLRGSAYLERYCLLIAFAAYLAECREWGRRATFQEWWAGRPDVLAARDFIHTNPASALAPVPGVLPATPAPPSTLGAGQLVCPGREGVLSLEEQRAVLSKRRGHVVGRRTILKSMPPPVPGAGGTLDGQPLPGVADVRAVHGFPVYTLGGASVAGLRALLRALGAWRGVRVVVTDLREEMALYVAGEVYLRRELESPAAAAHHAGIQGDKLAALERRLRSDALAEAAAWGGFLLLHREVARPVGGEADLDGGGGRRMGGAAAPDVDACAPRAAKRARPNDFSCGDITRSTQFQPTTEVQPFWAAVGPSGDVDSGLATPAEVFAALAADGARVAYRRVSELSRNVGAGEYRGIMNLCRVLRAGADAKEAVDAAIDACGAIGDLRADIAQCRASCAAATDDEGGDVEHTHAAASAARRLGLHYLQRYFLLIAYMGYMEAVAPPRDVSFAQWMGERREQKYLLATLELEVATAAGHGTFFVGGNWKANGSTASVNTLVKELNEAGSLPKNVEVVVAPPFIFLDQVQQSLQAPFQLAAQNCWKGKNGAFTGEITAEMLVDKKVPWVILGHSERRALMGDCNEVVAEKVAYALSKGLKVIACIGETLEERETGHIWDVLENQLRHIADAVTDWGSVVVAYEPVWAIGTGKVASPEQAQEVHAFLRKWLREKVGADTAAGVRVIYGGSVTDANAETLAGQEDVDGFLVGGASLKGPSFVTICGAATSGNASSLPCSPTALEVESAGGDMAAACLGGAGEGARLLTALSDVWRQAGGALVGGAGVGSAVLPPASLALDGCACLGPSPGSNGSAPSWTADLGTAAYLECPRPLPGRWVHLGVEGSDDASLAAAVAGRRAGAAVPPAAALPCVCGVQPLSFLARDLAVPAWPDGEAVTFVPGMVLDVGSRRPAGGRGMKSGGISLGPGRGNCSVAGDDEVGGASWRLELGLAPPHVRGVRLFLLAPPRVGVRYVAELYREGEAGSAPAALCASALPAAAGPVLELDCRAFFPAAVIVVRATGPGPAPALCGVELVGGREAGVLRRLADRTALLVVRNDLSSQAAYAPLVVDGRLDTCLPRSVNSDAEEMTWELDLGGRPLPLLALGVSAKAATAGATGAVAVEVLDAGGASLWRTSVLANSTVPGMPAMLDMPRGLAATGAVRLLMDSATLLCELTLVTLAGGEAGLPIEAQIDSEDVGVLSIDGGGGGRNLTAALAGRDYRDCPDTAAAGEDLELEISLDGALYGTSLVQIVTASPLTNVTLTDHREGAPGCVPSIASNDTVPAGGVTTWNCTPALETRELVIRAQLEDGEDTPRICTVRVFHEL